MSSDQDAESRALAGFVGLTNAPAEQARFFLEAADGSVERAVALYYEQTAATHRPRPTPAPPARPAPPATRRGRRGAGRRGGIFGFFLQVPVALVRTGANLALSAAGVGASFMAFLLPGPILRLLQGLARSLTDSSRDLPPPEAAQVFIRDFSQQYGNQGPQWEPTGWQQAATRAHQRFSFLFVYLHSPRHPNTEDFCRNTLCDHELAAYVDSTFVSWGGSIHRSDAFRLSSSLGASSYPYCALLAFSGARTQLIAAIQGTRTPQALLAALRHAVDRHGSHLAVEQADHNQRDMNRRLREEQDQAYQASLQADQAREREREKARLAAEAEARAAADAEQRARAEQEAQRLAAEQREAAREAEKTRKRAMLPPEPAAGSQGAAQIRIRLRDGTHQRNFPDEIPLQAVAHWVSSLDDGPTASFSLVSTYPRTVFKGGMLTQSLKQLGLAPQSMLVVHVEDVA